MVNVVIGVLALLAGGINAWAVWRYWNRPMPERLANLLGNQYEALAWAVVCLTGGFLVLIIG